MALQSSASDGGSKGNADRNTVFVDTNLDTHLAMIAYDADSVSDLKKRIMLEHPLCFPKIGQIQIHAIKVKRKGYFYHLSDSMLVRSAFSGFNKNWFLSIDASAVIETEKPHISNSPDSSNQLVCHGIVNNASIGAIDISFSYPSKRASDFNCFRLPQLENGHGEKEVPFVSPRVSEHSGKGVVDNLETVVKLSGADDTVIPSNGSIPEWEGDGFSKGYKDESILCDKGTLKSLPTANKKRKTIGEKDTVRDDACKDNNASVLGPGISMAVREVNLVPENPSGNASRDELGENSKNTSSVVQMSNDAVKETEAPKEHEECKDKSKENMDAEFVKSMAEPSERESTVNKKHKKRKRSLTDDSRDGMQKIEGASEQDEVCKSDEEQKKNEEPNEQVETNNDKAGGRIEFRHDKASQEPSGAGSPAKKKRKGKGRSGYESALKEKRSLVGDSNKESLKPDNASQLSLEELPKIKDSSADQSTERCGAADPLRTSVIVSKRKRKKKSSNNQTAACTSSRNDDADYSRIYGEGVQEEIVKDGQNSKDNIASKDAVVNSEIMTNISKEVTMSKVKRTGNSKDHCSIDVRMPPSEFDETKELTEGNNLHMQENIDFDHYHLSEAGQTVLAEEARKLSPLDDPKHQLSENCMTSKHNNTHANIRELTETSEVSKANETTECGKSEKRRKKRNAKDADGGSLLTEDFGRVDASKNDTVLMELCQATNYDPTSGNTMNEENLLNQTEGEEVQPEELKRTSDVDKEVNDVNVGSMEDISKTETHAENPSVKRSKKSKKKQTPPTKGVPKMLTKDQVLDHKEPSPGSDSRLAMELTSRKKKKSKSTSTKSTNKSSGPIMEPDRDVENEPPHSPSNAPKANYKSPPGANETAINSVSSFGHEDDNLLKAPTEKEINAEQNITSGQEQHKDIMSDDILVDKNDADRTDIEPMIGKNRKVRDMVKRNTHVGKLSSTKQLLSKVGEGLGIPDEKVPKACRNEQEACLSSQSNSVTSTIEENKRPQVNKSSRKSMNLEKNSEVFSVSNSKPQALKKMVQNKVGKASGNNIEGVVSKKEQKKSLLAGTIFKDDSSGTSEDKDEKVYDSSSSTRSPSDVYSDDDSDAGSHGGTGLETEGESGTKSRLSVKKGMPLDSILRSSRRYKKAKQSASQLEESESQPVDFVLDRLADT